MKLEDKIYCFSHHFPGFSHTHFLRLLGPSSLHCTPFIGFLYALQIFLLFLKTVGCTPSQFPWFFRDIHGQVRRYLHDTQPSCIHFQRADGAAGHQVTQLHFKGSVFFLLNWFIRLHRNAHQCEDDSQLEKGVCQEHSPRCHRDHVGAHARDDSSDVPLRKGPDRRCGLGGCSKRCWHWELVRLAPSSDLPISLDQFRPNLRAYGIQQELDFLALSWQWSFKD